MRLHGSPKKRFHLVKEKNHNHICVSLLAFALWANFDLVFPITIGAIHNCARLGENAESFYAELQSKESVL